MTASMNYWAPENLCANCRHPKDDHLTDSDQGWCTLPVGTCIYNPCRCKSFVEPKNEPRSVLQAGLARHEALAVAYYIRDLNARGDL